MPVVDWTRTDLDYPLPTGATALRFDHDRFAAFDLHVLKRANAAADYDAATQARAGQAYEAMGQAEIDALTRNISAGLPGATTSSQNLDAFRERIAAYRGITPDAMRANVVAFLQKNSPGRRRTRRAVDPAPRRSAAPAVRSPAHRLDRRALPGAVRRGPDGGERHLPVRRQPGSRADNDVLAMARQFASRIYFAHLAPRGSMPAARVRALQNPIISTAT